MEILIQLLPHWLLISGYTVLFAGMAFEGPALTATGAFAAALGYFNVYIVIALSILGNLLPDAIFYAIGFWGRMRLVEKYGRRFGLTEERIKYLEKLLATHPGKALTVIKLLPILPTPGLMLAGAMRMSIKKYAFWSIVITLPTSLFYLIIGYYFGAAYKTALRYVEYGGYFLIVIIILFILIYLGYRKLTKKIEEKIEKY